MAYYGGSNQHAVLRQSLFPFLRNQSLPSVPQLERVRVRRTQEKIPIETFGQEFCSTVWAIVPVGVYPATFMIYEALHARALPIIVLPASRHRPPHTFLDRFMPFYDEGVHFSRFGTYVFWNTKRPSKSDAKALIAVLHKFDIKDRRHELDTKLHFFRPTSVMDYAIRIVQKERARHVAMAIAKSGKP